MRLPQDRILHIDTEFVDGKVNVKVEWQGELVRCKDCRHRKAITVMNSTGFDESIVTEWGCNNGLCDNKDNDFCSYGERKEE